MRKVEVLLAGLGGQGVQLAGDILAQACTLAGRRVSVLPSYGAEARGTLIRAELVISDEDIVYPGVLEPDICVAFSQEAYDYVLPALTGDTVVFYDSASVMPAEAEGSAVKQHAIAAMEAASEAGNPKAANMAMLGAIAAASELVEKGTLEEVLSQGPKKRAKTSIMALKKGYELARRQLGSNE